MNDMQRISAECDSSFLMAHKHSTGHSVPSKRWIVRE